MPENATEGGGIGSGGGDPESNKEAQAMGGAYNLGPKPDPAGETELGGLVPPYEGRTGGDESASTAGEEASKAERAESVRRSLRGQEQPQEPTQPESSAGTESEGQMAPEGVGESLTRSGEDVVKEEGKEAGRVEAGTHGQSQRSAGTSTDRDLSGI